MSDLIDKVIIFCLLTLSDGTEDKDEDPKITEEGNIISYSIKAASKIYLLSDARKYDKGLRERLCTMDMH